MAVGTSGRIVLEVEPELKRELHEVLKKEGKSLKQWFTEQAEAFLHDKSQLPLFQEVEEGDSREIQS